MSELKPGPQSQSAEDLKPHKLSLTELLRSDTDDRPTMLNPKDAEPDAVPAIDEMQVIATDSAEPSPEGVASDLVASESAPEEVSEHAPAVRTPAKATERVDSKYVSAQRAAAPTTTGRSFGAWQAAGIGLAGLGVMLLAGPHFSVKLSRFLESFGDLRVQSGALIVGGLIVYSVGVVRHALRDLRSSLQRVSEETARLEEIAHGGRTVIETLSEVRVENTALQTDVSDLQVRLKDLTELVSSPDYTVSIFRLAASVDQLGKHVAAYMKEQFGVVQQRLLAGAEHAEATERQLSTSLGQLVALAKEQHRTQSLAMKAAFEELNLASDQTTVRIEQNLEAATRIETQLQNQQVSLSNGFTGLSERSQLSTGQMTSGLNDLRGRFDRQLENQSASLHAEFVDLANKIDLAECNQASGTKQLTEHVRLQFASHVEDLQKSLKSSSELASRRGQEFAGEFSQLGARLDEYARDQQASLQQVREQSTDATRAAKAELSASIGQLGAQLDQWEREQLAALQQSSQESQQVASATKRDFAASLEQLKTQFEQASREQLAATQQTSQETQQVASASRRDFAASLEQLKTQFEQASREHLAALRKNAQEAQQAAGATKQEFSAGLEQIRARLEQQAHEQLAALHRTSQDTQQASGATRRELATDLQLVGSRIEKALEVRTNKLTDDVLAMAEMFDSIAEEVRTCISESIGQLAVVRPVASVDDEIVLETAQPENLSPANEIAAALPAAPAQESVSCTPPAAQAWPTENSWPSRDDESPGVSDVPYP